jgi:hypothetical protein
MIEHRSMSTEWSPPPDHAISITRAKELMAGDYGSQIIRIVPRYVAPVFWLRAGDDGPIVVTNGTVLFLDTGTTTLIVTANHVIDDYKKAAAEGRVRCQILNLEFDPVARLIDSNTEYDIATLAIARGEIERVGSGPDGSPMFLTGWPPQVPDVERGILFAGFPGNQRLRQGAREVNFGIYTAAAVATTISPRNITCQIDHSVITAAPQMTKPPPGYDPGGISGGPILTLIERSNIVTWRLGGVIYEASPDMDMIFATRADVIQPDRKIVPPY